MKIGENVCCIKDYTEYPSKKLEKGKLYKIRGVIDFFDNNRHKQIKAINVNYTTFTLRKEPERTLHLRFDDYFITLKELRKLKLEKLKSL